MKKKIAWVIDSTAYVTNALKQHPDVYVVPMVIIFGNDIYEDGITIQVDELYEKMKAADTLPTTSQPAVGTFVELYEKLHERYEKVIMLHISAKLSGTYEASRQAAEMAGLDYYVIDTKVTSAAISFLVEEGIYLEGQGKTFEEIIERLEEIVPTLENYILIGNLQQLHKGGRMTNAQYVLGTLLSIKPILQIQSGLIEVYEKVRSEKKATKRIMEQCEAAFAQYNVNRVAVIHGNREQAAAEWKNMLLRIKPDIKVEIVPLPSTLAVHAGEGTLALMWYNTALEA
ncbi:MAG: DegV family protein [Ectobacillus sp.]